jgi:hypothetical protein
MFGVSCRIPEGQLHPCGVGFRSVAASPFLPLTLTSTKTTVVTGLNAVVSEVLLVVLLASRRDGSTAVPSPYLKQHAATSEYWTGTLRVLACVLTVGGALALPQNGDAGRVRGRRRRWQWRGRKGWDCVPANIE